jgi:hypothetical protein
MSAGRRPPAVETPALASALKWKERDLVFKRQLLGRENLMILFAVIAELPEA